MKLQVLLSAMYLDSEDYIDTLNITSDAVVINQCNREVVRTVTRTGITGIEQKVKYIESKDRGLSKSRNLAISQAEGDICIFCDNDVEYVSDYESRILDAYENHPDADLIVFYIQRDEKPIPNYPTSRRMDYLSVLKIFSPEISFKRDSIKGIRMNERFGAGAEFFMGEENIFLYDCLKCGLKIYYEPVKIAALRKEESTWFTDYDDRFFISRGANYRAMSRLFCMPLILQFAFRKKSLYGKNMTTTHAIKMMLEGKKQYEDICNR